MIAALTNETIDRDELYCTEIDGGGRRGLGWGRGWRPQVMGKGGVGRQTQYYPLFFKIDLFFTLVSVSFGLTYTCRPT